MSSTSAPPSFQAETTLAGTAVSRGIAIGPIVVAGRDLRAPEVYAINKKAIVAEKKRFLRALDRTQKQLAQLQAKMEQISGNGEGLVFEAHSMILDDPGVVDQVQKAIEERQQNAEFCFYAVMQSYIESMRRVSDVYLKERSADIEDVCQRVLRNFNGDEHALGSLENAHLLAAYDLTPSDTASIDREKILGFVTEAGSVNSHTAILARALGLPAVVGIENVTLQARTLAMAIIDGYKGLLILHPSEATLHSYQEQLRRRRAARDVLEATKDQESVTQDGRHIQLSANIEFTHELDQVKDQNAQGVGLFRTEFYLLEAEELPDEDAQAAVYQELAVGTDPHQAIIRTLDAGGDKLPIEALLEPEPNPFLGWRGVRVSLDRPVYFKQQIRAILRAAKHGNLGMMFPFISGVGEFRQCREIVAQCQAELEKEGVPHNPDLEIGAMIEIPSAALVARQLAKEADFFSIGTNDLIQYTVAVDRINHHVAHLYRSSHPGVIHLIHLTTQAAREAGIWTGVCGEMAADLNLTPLLIGLGVNELSVGPHDLAPVRKALRSLDYSACQSLAEEALTLSSSSEILELCQDMAYGAYPELLEER